MNSNFTKHARRRMQQRAITALQVTLIETFGKHIRQKGNTEYAFVPDEEVPLLRCAVDRLRGVRLILDATGQVITAMHETRRLKNR